MIKKNAYFVIRRISPQGEVTTLKDHDGRELHFDACGLVCDDDGNIIACDMGSRCIKKISPAMAPCLLSQDNAEKDSLTRFTRKEISKRLN